MNNAGKIAISPKGEYNNNTLYPRLSCVSYDGGVYLSKKETQGNLPTRDNEFWMYMFGAKSSDYVLRSDIATTEDLGIVKPDGDTILVDEMGVLSTSKQIVSLDFILESENWDGNTYIIEDENILADSDGVIGVSPGVTDNERKVMANASISILEQTDGALTLVANHKIPNTDLHISLMLINQELQV